MANIFDDIVKKLKESAQEKAKNTPNSYGYNRMVESKMIPASEKSEKPSFVSSINNWLNKYLTTEGVKSLNDSAYKKFSESMDKTGLNNISLNSNNIGQNITQNQLSAVNKDAGKSFVAEMLNDSIEYNKKINQGINFVADLISGANKTKLNQGIANPLSSFAAKSTPLIQKGMNYAGNTIKNYQQDKLDEAYSALIKDGEVVNKVKQDNTYANKLFDEKGEIIDYNNQIETLKTLIGSTPSAEKRRGYQAQIEEIKQIQNDQNALKYASYEKYLRENGATEEEMNQFKHYVVAQDDSNIEQLVKTVGSTLEGWAGSFAKAFDGLYGATSKLLGVDYDANDPNSVGNVLIDNSEDLLNEVQSGELSDVGRVIVEVYSGVAPFIYDMVVGTLANGSISNTLSDPEAMQKAVGKALLLSDVSVFGSNIKEKMDQGYNFDEAFINSTYHAALNHLTEQIGGEALVDGVEALGRIIANPVLNKLGQDFVKTYLLYTAKQLAKSFGAEAIEEGMEAVAAPVLDAATLNTGMTLQQYLNKVLSKDTTHQMIIGGLGGLLMGAPTIIASTIANKSQYNQLKAYKNLLEDQLVNNNYNAQEKIELQTQINNLNSMLKNFVNDNQAAMAIIDEDTSIKMSAQEVEDASLKASKVDIVDKLTPVVELKQQLINQVENLDNLVNNQANENNINQEQNSVEQIQNTEYFDGKTFNEIAEIMTRQNEITGTDGRKYAIYVGEDSPKNVRINNNDTLSLSKKEIQNANSDIKKAVDSGKYISNLKSFIKDIFDNKITEKDIVLQNVTTSKGKPYVVNLYKTLAGKVLSGISSGYEYAGEIVAMFNHIDEIAKTSNYLVSTEYDNYHGKNDTGVKRYDYFINKVETNKGTFLVQLDVEVSNINRLRTYKVVNLKMIDPNGGLVKLVSPENLSSTYNMAKTGDIVKHGDDVNNLVDEINRTSSDELTVENLDDVLQQREIDIRTLKAVEKAESDLRQNANEWIKGYDTLRAQFPVFAENTFKDALYEILIYGDVKPETYNLLANSLSAEYSLEGHNGDIKNDINEFVNESLKTFNYATKYYAGEVDTKPIRRAMKINEAYGGQDIEAQSKIQEQGSILDKTSSDLKQSLQIKYQDITEKLIQNDSRVRETTKHRSDSAVSNWKTMDQNLFELASGNKEVYDELKQMIRFDLLDNAAATRRQILNHTQKDVINKVISETGIKGGTKEDVGLQYYLEQHTEKLRTDIDINSKVISQGAIDEYLGRPFETYTLEDLKRDYDYKMDNGKLAWENIVVAAEILRNDYDETYNGIIRSQLNANGDVIGEVEQKKVNLKIEVERAYEALEKIKAEIVKNGSTQSTQAAYEIQKKRLNQLINQYNRYIEKIDNKDAYRRHLTPYRENYSHHIVKKSLANTLRSIRHAELATPTELSGISDYTKPNTAWASFMAAQDGLEYTPGALDSYAAYMADATNLIAYNPVILELRQFAKDIEATGKGNILNKFHEYLNDYCNMLAGKRNSLDRSVQKLIGPKNMRAITAANSYAKAAAIAGNVRSALVQFANIPNGLGILQSKGGKAFAVDVGKGMRSWIKNMKDTGTSAIDQSSFMSNRWFDFDIGESGAKVKIKNALDFMMSAGDKIGAEVIWWSAYEQGQRTGVDNAVLYADDITRSAIAGRTKEDMSLAMTSQVMNLLLPFSVETNNLYQTLKQEAKSGDVGGLMTYTVAAYIFNAIIKHITNSDDEVLPELVTPIFEELKALNEGQDVNKTIENMLLGEVAEFVSLLPYGSTAIQTVFGKDSETVFGKYDPNRYGTNNIGASGFGNAIRDLIKHSDDPAQMALDVVENLLEGYVPGGKQIMRTTEGLQSMGGLPDYKNKQIETSPIVYNNKGGVAYVNNQENVADWIRAAFFGKYSTSGAKDYIDNNFKSLSKSAENVFDKLQESNDGSAYDNYKTAQEYANNKSDKDMPTLREQLLSEGKYGAYKDSIRDAYDKYLMDFYKQEHEDEEPKTFTQFANSYGLSSKDLQLDTYGSFYDQYGIKEDVQEKFIGALKIENTTNALGKSIANSAATQRRVIYEQAGIYEQILDFIGKNNLEYSDFGLTKTVVGYNGSQIQNMLEKIGSDLRYEGAGKAIGGSGGSKSRASTKKLQAIIQAYLKALSTQSVESILKNRTSVQDAQAKVDKILKNIKR